MKLCAIHQPNFFPWLGYFDKIRRVDTFVFLDRANYPKSGSSMGSWCNRVKVRVNGRATWVSCPVIREHGIQPINSVRIDNKRPWRDATRKILQDNYAKARNFDSAYLLIDALIDFQSDSLADFNVNAITAIAGSIGLTPQFIRESQLPPSDYTSTARLVAILKEVGADTYLSGGGSGSYQDDSLFAAAGLEVRYQNFTVKPYGRHEEFIPGLSVIDWLMHRDLSQDTLG